VTAIIVFAAVGWAFALYMVFASVRTDALISEAVVLLSEAGEVNRDLTALRLAARDVVLAVNHNGAGARCDEMMRLADLAGAYREHEGTCDYSEGMFFCAGACRYCGKEVST